MDNVKFDGPKLRCMRREAGLSQAGLAGVSGLDHSMISRLESGDRCPSLPVFKAICDALGVTMTDLIL
jgi:transcriptional regulator with XRE-family HTH domain